MALTAPNNGWQSVTLTKDEIWGVIDGSLRVSYRAGIVPLDNDSEDHGFDIPKGASVTFANGQTVYYRAGRGHETMDNTFERVEAST